jgi:uncharacterized iron-regulated membrane protein
MGSRNGTYTTSSDCVRLYVYGASWQRRPRLPKQNWPSLLPLWIAIVEIAIDGLAAPVVAQSLVSSHVTTVTFVEVATARRQRY